MLLNSSLVDLGPPPAVPEMLNLAQYVLAAGQRLPDKSALQILRSNGAERWSYGRLTQAVLGIASGLQARGLAPGARVLLRIGNSADFPLAFLACIAAGLVAVPTSAQLSAPEITAMTCDLDIALVLAEAGVALPALACPVLPTTALRAMEQLAPADWHQGEANRPAYIIFTSGTSGRPLAVEHAHRVILARRAMHQSWEGLTESDRLLHAGAFNWTYTLGTGLLDPWTLGATALVPGPGVAADQLGLLLRRFDATIFAAAPGVYRQMLRAPFGPLPKLRHGLSAGEKLANDTRLAWQAATGTPIFEAFGMSEVSTYISAAPGRAAPEGSIGYAQPGRKIAALGDDLTPVPLGMPGQLAVASNDPGLMLRYIDAPEATAARLAGGWFLTGDMVSMAPDGAVTSLGRADDLMNAGGFRVSPLEVEAAMNLCPGIGETAVAAIEVKPGVQVIACFYTAAAPLDETVLQAHAAAHLARYKQPRLYRQLDSLPRGANSKLNRRALRQKGN
jgi:acyl-coenzyme A synthetase/AMP-(fatty) acid ligase